MKRWLPLVCVPSTHQQSFAGRSLMSRLSAPTPDWFSWKHANAGAVTTDFKQCETDRIFLGAEYATDETFLILRHPITSPVLGDLEMVRGRYRLRHEIRHVTLAPIPDRERGPQPVRSNERLNRNWRHRFPKFLVLQVVGGSACSSPEIVHQHEPEADYQDANSGAHQHESSSRGPECCTPPCPLPLVWDGYGPDRAGHPRRVIGSAPHENKCVPSQFSKSPAPSPVLLKEVADKISRRNQPRDHKGRVKTGAGLEHFGARRPA